MRYVTQVNVNSRFLTGLDARFGMTNIFDGSVRLRLLCRLGAYKLKR